MNHAPESNPSQESAEFIGAGLCDFCGEQAPQLRVLNRSPSAGMCYCRKCAPASETDWPLPTNLSATDDEIAVHINALLDELKWFREHSVKIHLSPTDNGWNMKFTVPEK